MSRPKSAHDLSGLMKYLGRAPWDEMMDEMLVAHLGPACDAMDLEPDDIFDIIGDHWEAQLWGCAFEDLLTQELEPEGLNLVDEYLKRRGWNEKAPNKAYMRALRDTVMSLGHRGNCCVMVPSLNLVVVAADANWGDLKPGRADAGLNELLKLIAAAGTPETATAR